MLKFKGTLVILVIAVILIAYVIFVEVKNPTKEEKEEEEKIVFKIEDTDTVKTLKFNQDGKEIICEKKEDGWHITKPVKARGDEGIFNGLLANLAELKAEGKIDELQGDLNDYGLKEPVASIAITFNDGKSDTIFIGKKTFDDGAYYARIGEGNNIFSLASYIVDGYFMKTAFDLRDKAVISFEEDKVKEFSFLQEDKTIKCEKDENGRWRIKEPFKEKGDNDKISMWLNSVKNLNGTAFFNNSKDVDLSLYGLDIPFIDITILDEDKGQKKLYIGKKDDTETNYYAKRDNDPEIFFLSTASVDSLYQNNIEDWIDKSVFGLPFGEPVSFEIKKGDTVIAGTKDEEGNWLLSKPEEKKAVSWEIENQLANIINLKAENFAPGPREDAAFGLDKPEIRVEITNNTGEKAVLLIGKEDEEKGEFYARKEGEKNVFMVGKTIVESLSAIIEKPPYEGEEEGEENEFSPVKSQETQKLP